MGIIKKVFGASAIIIVANGLNRLVAILAAPILTRVLGPVPYGVVALVGTATSLASTFSLLGIDMAYIRFYFSETNSNGHAVETFCWRYAILSSITVAVLSICLWWLLLGKPYNDFLIALMVGLTIILFVTNAMSQTRARLREKYRRIGFAIIVSGISASLTTIGLAVLWRTDEWPLLIGFAFGIVMNLVIIGLPKGNSLIKPSGLTSKEKWSIIKLGLPGLVTGTMYWILSSSDRWFLKHFWGEQVVGIYSFAYNVAIIGIIVNSAMVLTWFPECIRAYEEDSQGASRVLGEVWGGLALSLLLVWLFVASIGGDIIRVVSDSQFHSGAVYIPWIAGGVFFYGIATLANTGLLISKNMRPAAFWWAVGALINLISNYFFIQSWGAFGAAITNCLSFGFVSFGIMWKSTRQFKLNIPWKRLVTAGTFILVMGLITNSSWHKHPALSICLKLPICLMISFFTIWFVTPEWVKRVVHGLDQLISEVRN